MTEIQYTTGVFQNLRVKIGFHLGRLALDLKKDTIIQFDGTTLKMEGVSHVYPELRAAVRADWLCLEGANVEEYLAKSANVKVRGAKGGKSVSPLPVEKDESFVAAATKKSSVVTTDGVRMETKAFNAGLVRDTEGDGRTVGPAIRPKVAASALGSSVPSSEGVAVGQVRSSVKTSFTLDGSTTMQVDEDGGIRGIKPKVVNSPVAVEAQEAVVIGGVKSPTKRKATVDNSGDAAREVHKLDGSRTLLVPTKGKKVVAAVAGDTLEQVLPALDPVKAKAVTENRRAERLAAVAKSEAKVAAGAVQTVADAEGDAEVPAAPVRVAAKATVKGTPKSVEDFVVNGDEVEIAPGIRWNKKLHWRIRVKTALQHRENAKVLQAILAYEVPSVVKIINESLANPA
jgi:hypothetical protein